MGCRACKIRPVGLTRFRIRPKSFRRRRMRLELVSPEGYLADNASAPQFSKIRAEPVTVYPSVAVLRVLQGQPSGYLEDGLYLFPAPAVFRKVALRADLPASCPPKASGAGSSTRWPGEWESSGQRPGPSARSVTGEARILWHGQSPPGCAPPLRPQGLLESRPKGVPSP